MSLAAFIVRRLLIIIPTLWVIATLTFFLVHAAPGDGTRITLTIPFSPAIDG